MKPQRPKMLYRRVREILESARASVSRSVNTTQVVANWLIGREIVEEEQRGKERADYGKRLIQTLSVRITKEFGTGYSVQNLFYMKQLYLTYPRLLPQTSILHTVRGESSGAKLTGRSRKAPRVAQRTYLFSNDSERGARGIVRFANAPRKYPRTAWRILAAWTSASESLLDALSDVVAGGEAGSVRFLRD